MRDLDIAQLLVGNRSPIRGIVPLIDHFIMQSGRDGQDVLSFLVNRDMAPEELAARGLFRSIFNILRKPFGFRDITPEELAARSLHDFITSLDTRDDASNQLNIASNAAHVLPFLVERDIAPEELAARGLFSSIFNILRKPLGFRDITPEGIVARSLRGFITSLDTRDDASDQLNALLQSRDVAPEKLASLITRSCSFGDLD